ncbi:MAG: phosphate signaling complex protein PhoU [Pseudomonadota bacterium]
MVDASLEKRHTVRSFDDDLKTLTGRIVHMGALAEQQVAQAVDAIAQRRPELAAHVIDNDPEVDDLEEEIDQYAIRLLAMRQPLGIDLRIVAMSLKISNDLERISDYAVSIAKRAQRLADEPEFRPLVILPHMSHICQGMVKDVLDALLELDADKAMEVWHRDDEVDQLYTTLFRELLTYVLEDPRRTSICIDLLFVAKNLERIGDHATNIAEKIHYMIHGAEINRMRNRPS